MEQYKEHNVDDNNNNKRKRVSEDNSDDSDSAESKLSRVDSVDSEGNSAGADVVDVDASNSDDSSSGVNSPAAKLIQGDLLSSILDESDPDPAIQGLDSVIKSFEEEILFSCDSPPVVMSDSGEQRLELGYLLEASDDELGLPPAFSAGDEQNVGEAVDLKVAGLEPGVAFDNIGLGFDDGILSYDPYKFGIGGDSDNNNFSHDFITLGGGLFDSYEPAESSEHAWRHESLSAS